MGEGNVAPDPLTDPDPYAQLLLAFANQSLFVGLARLDLAAGKLPPAGYLGRFRPFAAEKTTVNDDRRTDDDQRGCPFGVHGPQAWQMLPASG